MEISKLHFTLLMGGSFIHKQFITCSRLLLPAPKVKVVEGEAVMAGMVVTVTVGVVVMALTVTDGEAFTATGVTVRADVTSAVTGSDSLEDVGCDWENSCEAMMVAVETAGGTPLIICWIV